MGIPGQIFVLPNGKRGLLRGVGRVQVYTADGVCLAGEAQSHMTEVLYEEDVTFAEYVDLTEYQGPGEATPGNYWRLLYAGSGMWDNYPWIGAGLVGANGELINLPDGVYIGAGDGTIILRIEIGVLTCAGNLIWWPNDAPWRTPVFGSSLFSALNTNLNAVEEGEVEVENASMWPEEDFWIRNTNANDGDGDCRFVNSRVGNVLACSAITEITLQFDEGVTPITTGNNILGATTGAIAKVKTIVVTSGDWSEGNASGYMSLEDVVGVFENDELIKVFGVSRARAASDSAPGARGLFSVNWTSGQVVELMPDEVE